MSYKLLVILSTISLLVQFGSGKPHVPEKKTAGILEEPKTDGAQGAKNEKNYFTYPKYKYSYGVGDFKTGDYKTHVEERDGDTVRGEYNITDPNGVIRTVKYTADDKHGFQVEILSSDELKNRKHSSTVAPPRDFNKQATTEGKTNKKQRNSQHETQNGEYFNEQVNESKYSKENHGTFNSQTTAEQNKYEKHQGGFNKQANPDVLHQGFSRRKPVTNSNKQTSTTGNLPKKEQQESFITAKSKENFDGFVTKSKQDFDESHKQDSYSEEPAITYQYTLADSYPYHAHLTNDKQEPARKNPKQPLQLPEEFINHQKIALPNQISSGIIQSHKVEEPSSFSESAHLEINHEPGRNQVQEHHEGLNQNANARRVPKKNYQPENFIKQDNSAEVTKNTINHPISTETHQGHPEDFPNNSLTNNYSSSSATKSVEEVTESLIANHPRKQNGRYTKLRNLIRKVQRGRPVIDNNELKKGNANDLKRNKLQDKSRRRRPEFRINVENQTQSNLKDNAQQDDIVQETGVNDYSRAPQNIPRAQAVVQSYHQIQNTPENVPTAVKNPAILHYHNLQTYDNQLQYTPENIQQQNENKNIVQGYDHKIPANPGKIEIVDAHQQGLRTASSYQQVQHSAGKSLKGYHQQQDAGHTVVESYGPQIQNSPEKLFKGDYNQQGEAHTIGGYQIQQNPKTLLNKQQGEGHTIVTSYGHQIQHNPEHFLKGDNHQQGVGQTFVTDYDHLIQHNPEKFLNEDHHQQVHHHEVPAIVASYDHQIQHNPEKFLKGDLYQQGEAHQTQHNPEKVLNEPNVQNVVTSQNHNIKQNSKGYHHEQAESDTIVSHYDNQIKHKPKQFLNEKHHQQGASRTIVSGYDHQIQHNPEKFLKGLHHQQAQGNILSNYDNQIQPKPKQFLNEEHHQEGVSHTIVSSYDHQIQHNPEQPLTGDHQQQGVGNTIVASYDHQIQHNSKPKNLNQGTGYNTVERYEHQLEHNIEQFLTEHNQHRPASHTIVASYDQQSPQEHSKTDYQHDDNVDTNAEHSGKFFNGDEGHTITASYDHKIQHDIGKSSILNNNQQAVVHSVAKSNDQQFQQSPEALLNGIKHKTATDHTIVASYDHQIQHSPGKTLTTDIKQEGKGHTTHTSYEHQNSGDEGHTHIIASHDQQIQHNTGKSLISNNNQQAVGRTVPKGNDQQSHQHPEEVLKRNHQKQATDHTIVEGYDGKIHHSSGKTLTIDTKHEGRGHTINIDQIKHPQEHNPNLGHTVVPKQTRKMNRQRGLGYSKHQSNTKKEQPQGLEQTIVAPKNNPNHSQEDYAHQLQESVDKLNNQHSVEDKTTVGSYKHPKGFEYSIVETFKHQNKPILEESLNANKQTHKTVVTSYDHQIQHPEEQGYKLTYHQRIPEHLDYYPQFNADEPTTANHHQGLGISHYTQSFQQQDNQQQTVDENHHPQIQHVSENVQKIEIYPQAVNGYNNEIQHEQKYSLKENHGVGFEVFDQNAPQVINSNQKAQHPSFANQHEPLASSNVESFENSQINFNNEPRGFIPSSHFLGGEGKYDAKHDSSMNGDNGDEVWRKIPSAVGWEGFANAPTSYVEIKNLVSTGGQEDVQIGQIKVDEGKNDSKDELNVVETVPSLSGHEDLVDIKFDSVDGDGFTRNQLPLSAEKYLEKPSSYVEANTLHQNMLNNHHRYRVYNTKSAHANIAGEALPAAFSSELFLENPRSYVSYDDASSNNFTTTNGDKQLFVNHHSVDKTTQETNGIPASIIYQNFFAEHPESHFKEIDQTKAFQAPISSNDFAQIRNTDAYSTANLIDYKNLAKESNGYENEAAKLVVQSDVILKQNADEISKTNGGSSSIHIHNDNVSVAPTIDSNLQVTRGGRVRKLRRRRPIRKQGSAESTTMASDEDSPKLQDIVRGNKKEGNTGRNLEPVKDSNTNYQHLQSSGKSSNNQENEQFVRGYKEEGNTGRNVEQIGDSSRYYQHLQLDEESSNNQDNEKNLFHGGGSYIQVNTDNNIGYPVDVGRVKEGQEQQKLVGRQRKRNQKRRGKSHWQAQSSTTGLSQNYKSFNEQTQGVQKVEASRVAIQKKEIEPSEQEHKQFNGNSDASRQELVDELNQTVKVGSKQKHQQSKRHYEHFGIQSFEIPAQQEDLSSITIPKPNIKQSFGNYEQYIIHDHQELAKQLPIPTENDWIRPTGQYVAAKQSAEILLNEKEQQFYKNQLNKGHTFLEQNHRSNEEEESVLKQNSQVTEKVNYPNHHPTSETFWTRQNLFKLPGYDQLGFRQSALKQNSGEVEGQTITKQLEITEAPQLGQNRPVDYESKYVESAPYFESNNHYGDSIARDANSFTANRENQFARSKNNTDNGFIKLKVTNDNSFSLNSENKAFGSKYNNGRVGDIHQKGVGFSKHTNNHQGFGILINGDVQQGSNNPTAYQHQNFNQQTTSQQLWDDHLGHRVKSENLGTENSYFKTITKESNDDNSKLAGSDLQSGRNQGSNIRKQLRRHRPFKKEGTAIAEEPNNDNGFHTHSTPTNFDQLGFRITVGPNQQSLGTTRGSNVRKHPRRRRPFKKEGNFNSRDTLKTSSGGSEGNVNTDYDHQTLRIITGSIPQTHGTTQKENVRKQAHGPSKNEDNPENESYLKTTQESNKDNGFHAHSEPVESSDEGFRINVGEHLGLVSHYSGIDAATHPTSYSVSNLYSNSVKVAPQQPQDSTSGILNFATETESNNTATEDLPIESSSFGSNIHPKASKFADQINQPLTQEFALKGRGEYNTPLLYEGSTEHQRNNEHPTLPPYQQSHVFASKDYENHNTQVASKEQQSLNIDSKKYGNYNTQVASKDRPVQGNNDQQAQKQQSRDFAPKDVSNYNTQILFGGKIEYPVQGSNEYQRLIQQSQDIASKDLGNYNTQNQFDGNIEYPVQGSYEHQTLNQKSQDIAPKDNPQVLFGRNIEDAVQRNIVPQTVNHHIEHVASKDYGNDNSEAQFGGNIGHSVFENNDHQPLEYQSQNIATNDGDQFKNHLQYSKMPSGHGDKKLIKGSGDSNAFVAQEEGFHITTQPRFNNHIGFDEASQVANQDGSINQASVHKTSEKNSKANSYSHLSFYQGPSVSVGIAPAFYQTSSKEQHSDQSQKHTKVNNHSKLPFQQVPNVSFGSKPAFYQMSSNEQQSHNNPKDNNHSKVSFEKGTNVNAGLKPSFYQTISNEQDSKQSILTENNKGYSNPTAAALASNWRQFKKEHSQENIKSNEEETMISTKLSKQAIPRQNNNGQGFVQGKEQLVRVNYDEAGLSGGQVQTETPEFKFTSEEEANRFKGAIVNSRQRYVKYFGSGLAEEEQSEIPKIKIEPQMFQYGVVETPIAQIKQNPATQVAGKQNLFDSKKILNHPKFQFEHEIIHPSPSSQPDAQDLLKTQVGANDQKLNLEGVNEYEPTLKTPLRIDDQGRTLFQYNPAGAQHFGKEFLNFQAGTNENNQVGGDSLKGQPDLRQNIESSKGNLGVIMVESVGNDDQYQGEAKVEQKIRGERLYSYTTGGVSSNNKEMPISSNPDSIYEGVNVGQGYQGEDVFGYNAIGFIPTNSVQSYVHETTSASSLTPTETETTQNSKINAEQLYQGEATVEQNIGGQNIYSYVTGSYFPKSVLQNQEGVMSKNAENPVVNVGNQKYLRVENHSPEKRNYGYISGLIQNGNVAKNYYPEQILGGHGSYNHNTGHDQHIVFSQQGTLEGGSSQQNEKQPHSYVQVNYTEHNGTELVNSNEKYSSAPPTNEKQAKTTRYLLQATGYGNEQRYKSLGNKNNATKENTYKSPSESNSFGYETKIGNNEEGKVVNDQEYKSEREGTHVVKEEQDKRDDAGLNQDDLLNQIYSNLQKMAMVDTLVTRKPNKPEPVNPVHEKFENKPFKPSMRYYLSNPSTSHPTSYIETNAQKYYNSFNPSGMVKSNGDYSQMFSVRKPISGVKYALVKNRPSGVDEIASDVMARDGAAKHGATSERVSRPSRRYHLSSNFAASHY